MALEHRPHQPVVLVSHRVGGATALARIPPDAALQTDLIAGHDEDPPTHQLAQLAPEQGEQALHDDPRPGGDADDLVDADVVGEPVAGPVDGPAGGHRPQLFHQQLAVEGVGVVEVEGGALGRR